MLSTEELIDLIVRIHKKEISVEDPLITLADLVGIQIFIEQTLKMNESDYKGMVQIFGHGDRASSIRKSFGHAVELISRIEESVVGHTGSLYEYYSWLCVGRGHLVEILAQIKQAKTLKKGSAQPQQENINHLCACSIFAKTKELFYKDDHSVPDQQLRDAVYDSLRDSLEGKMFDGFYASTLTQLEDHRRLFEDYSALRRTITEPQKTLAKQLADMERKVEALTIGCNKNQKRMQEQDEEINELKKTIEQNKNSEAALKRLVSKR